MWKNYWSVAVRNLLRYKTYAAIKVLGLALGIAASVLMLMYVRHELSYDTWHKQVDRTYRVAQWWDYQTGERDDYAATSGNLAELLLKDHPAIEAATRFKKANFQYLSFADQMHAERGGLHADANVFDLLSYPLKAGDPATALAGPNAIVLTERLARKYFGDQNPVGQTMMLSKKHPVAVTAVMDNLPTNSHFTFDFLLSMPLYKTLHPTAKEVFGFTAFYNYVRLQPNASVDRVDEQIRHISDRYIGELQDQMGLYMRHYLQPLPDIYLTPGLQQEVGQTRSRQTLHLLTAVAVLILAIATVNFVNIAMAQSVQRSREVGMRKVVGAQRWQLFWQFLGESCVFACLGLGSALVLIQLGIPQLEVLAGKQLSLTIDSRLIHNTGGQSLG